jgi:hypothetical protein
VVADHQGGEHKRGMNRRPEFHKFPTPAPNQLAAPMSPIGTTRTMLRMSVQWGEAVMPTSRSKRRE